jgi:transcriptional regulator with XRE-family HTH domain
LIVTTRRAKSGSRKERSALRRGLANAGGTLDDIAAEMQRRWGFRRRTAYRHAHGWSQHEVAIRFRAVARQLPAEPTAVPAAAITGTRIGEYERWPHGGRRPSPYVLTVLSQVYGTAIGQLLDPIDRRAMPPPAQAVVAALIISERTVSASDRRAPAG